MGGYGRGRSSHISPKQTTASYRSVDVRRLHREGLLVDGCGFNWTWGQSTEDEASIQVRVEKNLMIVSYKSKRHSEQDWRHHWYAVQLVSTKCHLGGARQWFRCPGRGCGRRVAILYVGSTFACRHCLDLAYYSQRETGLDRLARRAEKIRSSLGWKPGILHGRDWSKPKHMHWKTFEALIAKYDRFEQASFRGILMAMGQPQDLNGDRF